MRSGRDVRLTLEQSQRLTRARTMGLATALPIYLDDAELDRIVQVILDDVRPSPASSLQALGYYDRPLSWFQGPSESTSDFIETYLRCVEEVPDFDTYFACLCEIHKRRRKYARILSAQPLPTMIQVSPRALLEFGTLPSPASASWLVWRKWLYDIDNRAAQETGYLFEPILAASLGGRPFGSRESPIRRRLDARKGRQVDCIVGQVAYEFKLRVTIAASGQGRFAEELDFAKDCEAAGYTPVLLVLDPTPSVRLEELSAAFTQVGGTAYISDLAWGHLEQQAGPTMATFVEKYVRRPISEIDTHSADLLDFVIHRVSDATFEIRLGDGATPFEWRIGRREDQGLAGDPEEDAS